jgi:hypothetical protein
LEGKKTFPDAEEALSLCLNEKQQFDYAVSSKMCQLKDLEIVKETGIKGFTAN